MKRMIIASEEFEPQSDQQFNIELDNEIWLDLSVDNTEEDCFEIETNIDGSSAFFTYYYGNDYDEAATDLLTSYDMDITSNDIEKLAYEIECLVDNMLEDK